MDFDAICGQYSGLFCSAFDIRTPGFGMDLFLSSPGVKHYSNEFHENSRLDFVTVSVTGSRCALSCSHCGGKLLCSMMPLDTPELLLEKGLELSRRGCRGLLISGGSDLQGAVPVFDFLPAIARLRNEGLKIIVHTGLADEKTVAGLKNAGVDQVLIDVIGDRDTVREVYHIDAGPEDFENCLALCLKYGIDVAPHIVLGLHFGRFLGEYRALEMITACRPKCFSIVVLKPLQGTLMEKSALPPLSDCCRFLAEARIANPRSFINLGCARPAGEYSRCLERAALEAGLTGISYPSPETVSLARERGFRLRFCDVCCTIAPFSFDKRRDAPVT